VVGGRGPQPRGEPSLVGLFLDLGGGRGGPHRGTVRRFEFLDPAVAILPNLLRLCSSLAASEFLDSLCVDWAAARMPDRTATCDRPNRRGDLTFSWRGSA